MYIRCSDEFSFWDHSLILVISQIDAEAWQVIITCVFEVFIIEGSCLAGAMWLIVRFENFWTKILATANRLREPTVEGIQVYSICILHLGSWVKVFDWCILWLIGSIRLSNILDIEYYHRILDIFFQLTRLVCLDVFFRWFIIQVFCGFLFLENVGRI